VSAPVNAGTYNVLASYVDKANYVSALASATITILKATPTFIVLSAPVIINGTATTLLSGLIKSGSLVPTGNVSITVNGVVLRASIGANGTFSASLHTAALGVGAYGITYDYQGDGNFSGASDTRVLDVTFLPAFYHRGRPPRPFRR
jgi:hypothetical protein